MSVGKQQLVKRMLVRTFGSASFMIPVGLGSICLSMAGLLGSPLGFFGLLGWMFWSVALARATWKLTIGRKSLSEKSLSDIRGRQQRGHLAYLRSLRREFRRDRDPRTSMMLNSLQRIYERLCGLEVTQSESNSGHSQLLYDQANQLYTSCLQSLERSLQLWAGAREMATEEVRSKLLADRDRTLTDVEDSIRHLDECLDQLRAAHLKADVIDNEDHARLRDDLEQGLNVARRVEERIEAIEQGLDEGERS